MALESEEELKSLGNRRASLWVLVLGKLDPTAWASALPMPPPSRSKLFCDMSSLIFTLISSFENSKIHLGLCFVLFFHLGS